MLPQFVKKREKQNRSILVFPDLEKLTSTYVYVLSHTHLASLVFDRLFLIGLSVHGRGEWRTIAKNFVITRTPTQVASHAQKYYNRKLVLKEKRRHSIHDIRNMEDNVEGALEKSLCERVRPTKTYSVGTKTNQKKPTSSATTTQGIGSLSLSPIRATTLSEQLVRSGNFLSDDEIVRSPFDTYIDQGSSSIWPL